MSTKDIIISTNKGNTLPPEIEFKAGGQSLYLLVLPNDGGTVSIEGSAGQLFAVTNSLSGVTFSANNQSGIPNIEAYDNGDVRLAEFGGLVRIGRPPTHGLDANCRLHLSNGEWGGLEAGGTAGGFIHLRSNDQRYELVSNSAGLTISRTVGGTSTGQLVLTTDGVFRPASDGTQSLGAAAFRWSQLFSSSGTINTSDAREKTPVRDFTENELAAAKALSKEIGIFKFLSMVQEKGDAAREHIGMTVQRAIEIMEAHNLDPFNYGFICYDEWDAVYETVDPTPETPAYPESYDADGTLVAEAVEAQPGNPDGQRIIQPGGSRYSFRTDELLLFICKGFEARLSMLEGL